jgi:arabinogalactan endo-1,4-beta-galactosidase
VLEDSLYHYVYSTLLSLNTAGALPDMVQIGNETNKGIMLSPAVDAGGWSLDWYRNSRLFRMAIRAVRDVETVTGKPVKVALHIAGPADAGWLMQGFQNSGVTDFDIIGLSYYWAWHQPTSIEDAGNVVAQLKSQYPGKEVMIFETGYIWTNQSNDNAANIISAVHPDYAPASPENQRRWLIDMTQEVLSKGASGVIYWEPAWVSSPCYTPWGQGSHQEHATFFDFQNNLMENGGISMYDYQYTLSAKSPAPVGVDLSVVANYSESRLQVYFPLLENGTDVSVRILSSSGKEVRTVTVAPGARETVIPWQEMSRGVYYAALYDGSRLLGVRGFLF